ncbi:MAG: GNAT family N-acetyltransferase [Chloroflexi bacterium]|nr:GNAT family N-acetyltransferase [Chloroflexota bacterium]
MEFRSVAISDVDALWELQTQLDNETKFMLYEAGERKKDLGPVEEVIRPVLQGRDFFEVAVEDDKLVGYLSARRGALARTQHSVYVVTGVLKAYQNRGIATTFFTHLDQWARQNNVKRMELVVMAPNEAAIHVYQKAGFVLEGTLRYAVVVDGKFIDEFTMAKLIE